MKRRIALVTALLLSLTPLLSGSVGPDDREGAAPASPTTLTVEPALAQAEASTPATVVSRTHPLMGDVIFPHEEHVSDLEITCEECHHEVNATRLVTPHSDYLEGLWINCKICHNGSSAGGTGPEACSNCHRSHRGGSRDQTLSTKVVVHQLCWSCHESGTGVEASESCQQCHTGVQEES